MNKLFFIFLLFLCIYSCKTQPKHSVNQYTTIPEVGILTTDLPRYSKPPISTYTKPKINENSPLIKDSILNFQNDPLLKEETVIHTIPVSSFSWEIGIKQTQIVDVRTLLEYKSGHIYDAVSMSVDEPSFVNQIHTLDKNSPVAVYCNSGIRSIYAATILKENGFLIIYNLEGGLNSWLKNGKEIIK